ncbi:MAG: MarR family winged helix-turn-helix transcriptional regulator, partial [Alphaproteobacteria bacterium]
CNICYCKSLSVVSGAMKQAPAPVFDLGNFIPYLVRRVASRVDEVIRGDLAAVGLTLEMWRVVVSVHVNGPQSLGVLAQRTSIHISTLSRLIGQMERMKLIRRRRVVGNGRTVEIGLLALGRARCRRFLPVALALERRMTKAFAEAELAPLRAALSRLYDAVAADSVSNATRGTKSNPMARRV